MAIRVVIKGTEKIAFTPPKGADAWETDQAEERAKRANKQAEELNLKTRYEVKQ